jgi:hypothetical protein
MVHGIMTNLILYFFNHLEKQIVALDNLSIECDLILFHSYDYSRWGFDTMDMVASKKYIQYMINRFAAHKNIWWSLANEYDFVPKKKEEDWTTIGNMIAQQDKYAHLRSVHNGARMYNHGMPWVTHVSLQTDVDKVIANYLNQYHKPVVIDECKYEGDLPYVWGDLTGKELTHRF